MKTRPWCGTHTTPDTGPGRMSLSIFCLLLSSVLVPLAEAQASKSRAHKDSSADIQITVYPHELSVREGKDASFECRARSSDNQAYPQVRWTRVGGPLPSNAHESAGRLSIHPTHPSHSGRYACVAMHRGRSVEAYAQLHVQSYGPAEFQQLGDAPSAGCMADEKMCGSNECVKLDYVCDGEADCRDRSDEENCPEKRHCEPNEFRCANDRCIQKMWLCDGDDDCNDGSDERTCGARKPGDMCQPTEFRCTDGRQCVPQSFQCDGTNDCHDGSDEIGCTQPTVVQPPDSNKAIQAGHEFKLTCRAVGVPDPYINWRLNWGPVCEPPRCQQQSEGGLGTLTVQSAQPIDQGAYTCEAINVKGRVLATPDCIVRIVNIPAPQPPPRQPLTCHPQGAVSPYSDTRGSCACKPLVQGPTCGACQPGSYHLSGDSPRGCLGCFCFGITNQCRSSSWYRTKEKLFFAGDAQGITLVDIHQQPADGSDASHFDYEHYGFLTHKSTSSGATQYWRMPHRFLGDKVTAYGGKMSIQLRYDGSGSITQEPLVVLKGNGITLVHRPRDQESVFSPNQPFNVQVPTYEQSYEHLSGGTATREDLMMVLADLDSYLIRATHVDDQQSTSIGEVTWEIAVPKDTQDRLALEVEQCDCPPGYVGTSCEDCAEGYERSGHGPYLGTCVPKRAPQIQCSSVGAVSPTADYGGRCVCRVGYTGERCEQCAHGYAHLRGGETCERCECNGHASECDREHGYCINCQHNTEGDHCERCRPGFVGDATRGTPHDCKPEERDEARPPCQCYNHSPRGCDSFGRCLLCEHNTEGFHCETCKKGYYGDATHGTPYDCTPCPCPGSADCFLDSDGQVKCRNCPAGFAGRLCDECAPGYTRGQSTGGRDCEPIGRYKPDTIEFVDKPDVALRVEILPPKHLSVNLGSRAKWTCKVDENHRPEEVTLEWTKHGFAELPDHVTAHGNQLVIDSVREEDSGQYRCTGTYRGHIATDDASLTIQRPQAVDTWHRPPPPPQPAPVQHPVCAQQAPCPAPSAEPCPEACCPAGYTGQLCDQCDAGYQQRPAVEPIECEPEPTQPPVRAPQPSSSPRVVVTPPHQRVDENQQAVFHCLTPGFEDCEVQWHFNRVGTPLPQGVHPRGQQIFIPQVQMHHAGDYICTVQHGYNQYESNPGRLEVNRPTLRPMVDPPKIDARPGDPARFRCWVPGVPEAVIKWKPAHGGALPNGAEDRDGFLNFPRVDHHHSGQYICEAYDPKQGPEKAVDSEPVRLNIHEEVVSVVTPAAPPAKRPFPAPKVDPPFLDVNVGDPARFRCWVDGHPNAELRWETEQRGPLPHTATDRNGVLEFPSVSESDSGAYVCAATDPETGRPVYSPPVNLSVRPPKKGAPPRPVATPPVLTVQRGSPARFHCDANSPDSPAEIHWAFGERGGSLRGNTIQEGDDVYISEAEDEDAGEYLCSATNEFGSGHAEPVKLIVSEDEQPPTARVEPKVWNGDPGTRHQFKCHTTGLPTPEISWSGPGGGALPDDVVDLGDGVLEITNAKKSVHDGEYTCTATNRVGTASDHGTVNINPNIIVKTTPAGPKLVFTVGEKVEIKCEAFGEPEPDVEWLHDPGPRRGDLPDDFVPIDISEQFIRHPAIGLLNAGRYTCRGSNKFASVTKDIYIEVVEPTQKATVSVLGGANQWFPVGQPAKLICAASAPALIDKLEWTRQGGGHLPGDVEQPSDAEGVLRIPAFKQSHEGEYECRAYRKDDVISSSTVHLYSDVNLKPDVMNVEITGPQVRVVQRGDSIVLDCVVHGRAVEDFRYTWSLARGGSLVRQLGKESQLIVKGSDPTNDYGIYRCEVENEEGDSVGSAQAAVAVGFHSPAQAQEAKFDEDSEAVLECPVFVVPGSVVTWSRQGDDLPANAAPKGNTLVIEKFDDDASGIYTCSVQYESSSVEGFVNAKIFVPDTTIKVMLNISNPTIQVGDRVWLDCIVVGDVGAKIEFSKSGMDGLPENAQVTGNRLLFTAISEENAGTYKCVAHTSEGDLETTAVLGVEAGKRKRKHLPHPRAGGSGLTKHHITHDDVSRVASASALTAANTDHRDRHDNGHHGHHRGQQHQQAHHQKHHVSAEGRGRGSGGPIISASLGTNGHNGNGENLRASQQRRLRQLQRRRRIAAARRQQQSLLAKQREEETRTMSKMDQHKSEHHKPQQHHTQPPAASSAHSQHAQPYSGYSPQQNQHYNHYDVRTASNGHGGGNGGGRPGHRRWSGSGSHHTGSSVFGSWFASD